jgi:formylglycine-generating enzyme required for sulfatase activity
MGSAEGRPDERPPHFAHVDAFRLGRTPVTCREYEAFLRLGRAQAPPWWSNPLFSMPNQPVVGVTWFDAVAYAAWLSEVCGGNWRLPTEAEWERAARGGIEGAPTSWGEALPPGEIPVGSIPAPWPVGRGTPNGFGLFDMGTIVHEWCLDWYRADLYGPASDKPPVEAPTGPRRSSRGGSWRHHVPWSSPSARSSLPPDLRYADYGFRVLREVP